MKRTIAALGALALVAACRAAPARTDKPDLLFLTSLPILFAEDFTLEAPKAPLREALEARYVIRPIDLADGPALEKGRLLLMAQPRAQTAEALVDLDAWVRGGGRLLLLADPKLDWPTTKPLGDPSAPMPAFADTGLLGHWGLTLYRPDGDGSTGTMDARAGSGCALDRDGAVARCTIGEGRVIIIADADFARDEAGAKRVGSELEKLAAR